MDPEPRRHGIQTLQGPVRPSFTRSHPAHKCTDLLFHKLHERFDLSRVKSIGGSAQPATVWLTSEYLKTLSKLQPASPLHAQIPASFFSLLHTPVVQDTSTLQQTAMLQERLGGAEAMAERVGVCAHPSLIAVQCMKIREGNPDAWRKTARVMLASQFLCSLLVGCWTPMTEAEVASTGLWDARKSKWDHASVEVVAGGADQGRRFADMLGNVEMFGGKNVGGVSSYFVERYGFDKGEHRASIRCLKRTDIKICFFTTRLFRHPVHVGQACFVLFNLPRTRRVHTLFRSSRLPPPPLPSRIRIHPLNALHNPPSPRPTSQPHSHLTRETIHPQPLLPKR